jgi:hypothetical protein
VYRRTGAKTASRMIQESPPRGAFLRPWVIARVGIERDARLRFEQLERLLVTRDAAKAFRTFVFLPSGHPAPSEGGGRSTGSQSDRRPCVWRRLCWSLERRAQADSNRSLVRPGRRREALRLSPLSAGSGPRAGPSRRRSNWSEPPLDRCSVRR